MTESTSVRASAGAGSGKSSSRLARAVGDPSALAGGVAALAAFALLLQWRGTSIGAAPAETVWRFYRAQPGYERQFTSLFLKNTYPVLQAQIEEGDLLDLQLYTPSAVNGIDTNWTLFVSIRYVPRGRGVPLPNDSIVQRLFRDRATYDLEKVAEAKLVDAQWEVNPRRLP